MALWGRRLVTSKRLVSRRNLRSMEGEGIKGGRHVKTMVKGCFHGKGSQAPKGGKGGKVAACEPEGKEI